MKRFKDERVTTEMNKLYAQAYYVIIGLSVIMLVLKLFLSKSFIFYLPEIIGGGGSLLFLLIRYMSAGVFGKRGADERISNFKTKTKAMCYLFCFSVYVLSGIPMMKFFPQYPEYYIAPGSALVAFISSIQPSMYSLRNGLLLWHPNRKKGMKRFRLGILVGGLVFGVLSFWTDANADAIGKRIVSALIAMFFWGIFMYVVMMKIYKKSEKNADEQVKAAEESDGER